MATGQVNVNRLIKLDIFFEKAGQFKGMPLGVTGGIFAPGVSGAGNQSAGERSRLVMETGFNDSGLRRLQILVVNTGQD